MVDFGSHSTRAGYAGEDTPRVVCPSFYGYVDEPSSSAANGNGAANGTSGGDAMEVDGEQSAQEGKKRKYYVGDDGVGVWRPDMNVDNFMQDGVGESDPPHYAR